MTHATEAPHIVVVGSVMVDLITYADPLPTAGQTVRGSAFEIGSGGKGANQAVVAHRLGSVVTLVARVGTDAFGDLSIRNLQQNGLDASAVKRVSGSNTGTAPIWVQSDGTNRIIIIPGANDALTAKAVAEDLASVEQAHCVVCQLEIPQDAVSEALKVGRRLGAALILNPAPAPTAVDARRLFGHADWVVPNEHEFELIWGTKPTEDEILAAAAEWNCGVVVTLGEKGAAATVDGMVVYRRPPEVKVTDTTGAGDAFVGGFAHGLACGMDVVDALEIGNICGALSTEGRGTQTSFPDAKKVQRVAERPRVGSSSGGRPAALDTG